MTLLEHADDLAELLRAIEPGYDVEPIGGEPSLVLVRKGHIDIDLLCEADNPKDIIRVEGQENLAVQGYPYLGMLLEASRRVALGQDFHASLDPPVRVRIPTLPAYTLGKVLSALNRQHPGRKAKDVVYLYQVLREGALRERLNAELEDHVARHPVASRAAAEALEHLWSQRGLLGETRNQVQELGLAPEMLDPVVDLRPRMRRLKDDLEGHLRG